MKKTVMILFCVFVPYFLIAQQAVKQKEIGLAFSNLDNFGLTYKFGTEKSLIRLHTLFFTGINSKETSASGLVENQNNNAFGIKLGHESHKNIVDNLEFRYGFDLSFTYSVSKSETDPNSDAFFNSIRKSVVYKPGFNFVLGANYVINRNFVVGVELLPEIVYSTGSETQSYFKNSERNENKSEISGFNYGFSSNSALITLTYRFKTEK
jgi:predicted Zn-dependent protease